MANSFIWRHSQLLFASGLLAGNVAAFVLQRPYDLYKQWMTQSGSLADDDLNQLKISSKTLSLLEEACEALGLVERPVVYVAVTPTRLGSFRASSNPFGHPVLLGLPLQYDLSSEKDLPSNMQSFTLPECDVTVPRSSKVGRELLDAGLLSFDARRFILARELCSLDSNSRLFRHVVFSAIATATYQMTYWRNRYLTRLYSIRGNLITSTITATLLYAIFYVSLSSMYEKHLDKSSDLRAISLGENYARGGIEFYEKKLECNRICREMSPKVYGRYYSTSGNERTSFMSSSEGLTSAQRLETVRTAFTQKYDEKVKLH